MKGLVFTLLAESRQTHQKKTQPKQMKLESELKKNHNATSRPSKFPDSSTMASVASDGMSSGGVEDEVNNLTAMMVAIDDDLSTLDDKIEGLKAQKRTLIQQRKSLSDKITSLKFQEVASIDWTAKSESPNKTHIL